MVFYFCNNSAEKNEIFLSNFEKYLLSLNKYFKSDFVFSPNISNSNSSSFNHSYLLNESDIFYLIDYLFFVEPSNNECRSCSFGYNKETESIIFKILERFKNKNFSLSPYEYVHLLKNNLLSDMPNFDLLFDYTLNSWFIFSNDKKVLLKNPTLPTNNQILNHLRNLNSIPFPIVESLSILLAKSLDIFDSCSHCQSKVTHSNYKFYLKLTFFDASTSSCKNIFLTDIDFENFNLVYRFLYKKRTT